MTGFMPKIANSTARGVALCLNSLRGIVIAAIHHARDRRAARAAARELNWSGTKLTDEMERKMIAQLTRNRNFRV